VLLALGTDLASELCPTTTLEAWTFTSDEICDALAARRLLCPSIELSDRCNLNCPYCFVEKPTSRFKRIAENELTADQTRDLIRTLADLGARTINIVGAGEPTLDPALPSYLELLSRLRIRPLVATNGIVLSNNRALVDDLVRAEASVVLKYNAVSHQLQDRLVGRVGYSALRDQTLQILCHAGLNKHSPTRLALNTLLMCANASDLLQIHQLARDLNLALIAGDYMPTGRTSGATFNGHAALSPLCASPGLYAPVTRAERQRIAEAIATRDARLGLRHPKRSAYVSGLPCVQALGLLVDNCGTIWHCPARQQLAGAYLIEAPLGSLRGPKPLSSVWREHPYLKAIRETYDGGCPYKSFALSAQNLDSDKEHQ
jgi:molybdenum cofactor biosynthesis enzyme MoaA